MFQIRPFVKMDFPCVKDIYQQGIDTGLATFQTKAKEWDEWDQSLIHHCRLVAVNESNRVTGWAALAAVSNRCCYAGVAEVTIYISQEARGYGAGKLLLQQLVQCSEERSYWTLKAGIFAQNTGSIALHEKCGFKKLGIQEKLGKYKDDWIDVVAMERRSQIVGID